MPPLRARWTTPAAKSRTLPLVLLGASVALVAGIGLSLPAVVGTDGLYSLWWGRDLVRGDLETFQGGLLPRPLLIAAGAAASAFGEQGGYSLYSVIFGPVALGVAVAAAFDIAWQVGSAWAGAITALILVTSPVLLSWTASANHGVALAALVLVALALELDRPRRMFAPLALLGLAGLIHPQAWLLSVGYWIWLGAGLAARRRALALGLVLLAPALWFLVDLVVMGDPVWSLRPLGGSADRTDLIETAGRTLVSAVGPLALVIAVLGYIPATRARIASLSLILNVLGLTVASFWIRAASGFGEDPHLPVLTAMLAVMAGVVAGGARFVPSALAGIAAFLVVFQIAVRLDEPGSARDGVRDYAQLVADADRLSDQPRVRTALARCATAGAPTRATAAMFAYFAGEQRARWIVDPAARRSVPVTVLPADRVMRAVPGSSLAGRTRSWELYLSRRAACLRGRSARGFDAG